MRNKRQVGGNGAFNEQFLLPTACITTCSTSSSSSSSLCPVSCFSQDKCVRESGEAEMDQIINACEDRLGNSGEKCWVSSAPLYNSLERTNDSFKELKRNTCRRTHTDDERFLRRPNSFSKLAWFLLGTLFLLRFVLNATSK